jgi:hypothetical protein
MITITSNPGNSKEPGFSQYEDGLDVIAQKLGLSRKNLKVIQDPLLETAGVLA